MKGWRGFLLRSGGWVCLAVICKNGPGLWKPWRSGRKVGASVSNCACVVQWQQGGCTLSTGLVVVVRVFGKDSGWG